MLASQWPVRFDPDSLTLARESDEWQLTGASARARGLFLFHKGRTLLEWGERETVEQFWGMLRGVGEQTRDPFVQMRSRNADTLLALIDGRFDDAIAIADDLQTSAESFGSQVGESNGARIKAECLRLRGDATGAADALSGVRDSSADRLEIAARFGGGDSVFMDALASMQRQPERLRKGDMSGLLQMAVQLGERNSIRSVLDLMAGLELTPLMGSFNLPTVTARHLGGALVVLDEPQRARDSFLEAIQVCTRVSYRPEMALARLELAELILKHYPEEQKEALDDLDFAIAEFREMKMQPALERALGHKGLLKA
jgi:hypothetical protein